jgi:hypothetical protein
MEPHDDVRHDPATSFVLGLLVLGLTVLFSNLPSMPIRPGEAILDRLADHTVNRLPAIGYPAQLASGLWLSFGLLFAPRHGTRLAFAVWLVAVCLFLAPVPTLGADPALVPALVVGAALLALVVRLLDRTTQIPADTRPTRNDPISDNA